MALHNSSYDPYDDHNSKPPKPKSNSGMTILLLVAAAVMAAFLIPSVRARINKLFPTETTKKVEMKAKVWADKTAGTYYCPDSKFFGHGTGTYMKQGDALTLGYQPALGEYCQEEHAAHTKAADQAHGRVAASTGSTSSHSSR